MMMKVLIIFLLSVLVVPSVAQELWMKPDKTYYKPGDTATIRFMVGNNFVGEPWNVRPDRIKSATLHQGNKVIDLKPMLNEGTGDHLKIYLKDAGTYLFSMESNSAFIELPADRFNSYLKDYSLDAAYSKRKDSNNLDKPGRESYARNAKMVIQVTQKEDNSFQKNTGMPIEIIPEKNPTNYKVGDMVYFKLLHEGKPLFGARAFVWNLRNNRLFTQPIYSQQDGRIEVRVFNEGDWMVSVVHMVPVQTEEADWQSYWGSFVFNVSEAK